MAPTLVEGVFGPIHGPVLAYWEDGCEWETKMSSGVYLGRCIDRQDPCISQTHADTCTSDMLVM